MRNNVWNLHGYFGRTTLHKQLEVDWQQSVSEFKGAQYGIGPSSYYEVIPVNRAGSA